MNHNTLSAASDERKARLAQLKHLKRKLPSDDEPSSQPPPEDLPPSQLPSESERANLPLSGRNYDPTTRGPKLGFEEPPTLNLQGPTLEQQALAAESLVKKQAAEDAQDDKAIDLFKLQPKKPNWDLKRNMEKRMEVLNVRTENAIARLVRERILGQKGGNDNMEKTKTRLDNGKEREADGNGKADGDGDGEGEVDGVALVEGLRAREREEEEEERREREDDEEETRV